MLEKKEQWIFSKICPRSHDIWKFTTIKKYFHVFDNEIFDENVASGSKETKWDGLIAYVNKRFLKFYPPEKELAIDENMCSWSGKGGSKVYMPIKPIKYGIKLYALCESKSGYACSLNLYNIKIKDGNIEMIKKINEKFIKFESSYLHGQFLCECKGLWKLKRSRILLLWHDSRKSKRS